MEFPVTERPNAIPNLAEDTEYEIQSRSNGEINVAFSATMPEATSQDAALLAKRGSSKTFQLKTGERAWVWGGPGYVYYR